MFEIVYEPSTRLVWVWRVRDLGNYCTERVAIVQIATLGM